MIIHPVEKTVLDDNLLLSAKIEFQTVHDQHWYAQWGIPENLWFRVPKEYEPQLTVNSNSFLVAILGVAMHLQENVHISGTVSSELLYNLKEYQRIANFWHPDFFSTIKITADKVTVSDRLAPRDNVMCSISGGFDSFYTIWSHLKRNVSPAQFPVTHVLYVEGLDVVAENEKTHEIKKARFKKIAREENLTFVSIATNARSFLRFSKQNNKESLIENAPLFASVLFFEGLISRFHFSSEDTFKTNQILNAPYLLMPLISTESIKTSVYGEVVSKQHKMHSLFNWPAARDSVICCHAKPDGLKNCGECEKCLRIIVLLAIENRLQDYKTFPNEINRKKFRSKRYDTYDAFSFLSMRLLLRRAYEKKRWSIFFNILWVMVMSTTKNFFRRWIGGFLRLLYSCIEIFNPLRIFYRTSKKLKQGSPTYSDFVSKYKKTTI